MSINEGYKNPIFFVTDMEADNQNPGGIEAYLRGLINSQKKSTYDFIIIGTKQSKSLTNTSPYRFIPIMQNAKKNSIFRFTMSLFINARKINVPSSSIINPQAIYYAFPFLIPTKKGKNVLTLHGTEINTLENKFGKVATFLFQNTIEKFIVFRMDKIIALNEEIKEYYLKRYPKLKDKIVVIPTAIDIDRFKPLSKKEMRHKYGFSSSDKIILFVGRFARLKGLDLLLRSFKIVETKIPDAKLVLVGGGRKEGELRGLAKKLELTNEIFWGTVDHDAVPEIMNCADVFALSSLSEVSPTVVKEALACGVPVVSTDVGDVHKLVKDGETGYIVKTRTEEEMSAKLIKVLLSNNDKFKENCISMAQQYSWNSIAKKIMGVYDEVLKKE